MFLGRVKRVKAGKYVVTYLILDRRDYESLKPKKIAVDVGGVGLVLPVKTGSLGAYAVIPPEVAELVDSDVLFYRVVGRGGEE